MLDATEGHRGAGHLHRVHRHHAELQGAQDLPDAADVVGVEVGSQPVLGVVGHLDDLVVVGIGGDPGHRREALLVPDLHVVGDAREQHRHEEVLAGRLALVAGHQGGALGDGVVDDGRGLLHRLAVDQRPEVDLALQAVAHGQGRHALGEVLDEFVMDRLVDQDAVRGQAVLSGGLELGRHRGEGRLPGVHVRPDDEGGVATQLQRDALHGVGTLLQQQPADPGGTGEGERLDAILAAQDPRHLGRLAQHHVEDPGRNAGTLGQFGQRQRRVRRLAGGLDDHRAAGGHGGGGLAGDHRQREVPGRDQGGDTHRLLDGAQGRIGDVAGDGLTEGALALLGEPAHEAGPVLHLAAGVGQRLALLEGHDESEVLAVGLQQVVPGEQALAPLIGTQGAPVHKGGLGGIHGAGDLVRLQPGDVAQGLASGRVEHGLLAVAVAVSPLAIHVGVLTEQTRIAELVGQSHAVPPLTRRQSHGRRGRNGRAAWS